MGKGESISWFRRVDGREGRVLVHVTSSCCDRQRSSITTHRSNAESVTDNWRPPTVLLWRRDAFCPFLSGHWLFPPRQEQSPRQNHLNCINMVYEVSMSDCVSRKNICGDASLNLHHVEAGYRRVRWWWWMCVCVYVVLVVVGWGRSKGGGRGGSKEGGVRSVWND